MTAIVTEEFLKKYNLEANNAILAGDHHKDLCKDMEKNFHVEFIAGGAAQNSMRVAQWFFKKSRVTTFFGAIGKDAFGEQMRKKAEEDRVNVSYYVDLVPV